MRLIFSNLLDARKACKIHFGHGWDLATFSNAEELADVNEKLKIVNEALWVGYKNTENGFVDNFGNKPSILLPWDQSNKANPEPNGASDSCVR